MSGSLVLCGTPIGNLDDMAPRAVETLRGADVIACEDTRRTRKLLTRFGISARELVVLNERTERRRAAGLVEQMRLGRSVVLVSDAGMPGLSDPGYRLVEATVAAGIEIRVVPGPNAAVSAVAISGLPPGRFLFEGFLPRKSGERRRHLESLAEEPRTLVFYESPHRIEACLRDMLEVLGPRDAALARELTKMHEEVLRGSLAELLAEVQRQGARGEMVLVVHGATRAHRREPSARELALRARALMDEGSPRKEALVQVARETQVPKRKVFDALLRDGEQET